MLYKIVYVRNYFLYNNKLECLSYLVTCTHGGRRGTGLWVLTLTLNVCKCQIVLNTLAYFIKAVKSIIVQAPGISGIVMTFLKNKLECLLI
jgi:hypothetical protein